MGSKLNPTNVITPRTIRDRALKTASVRCNKFTGWIWENIFNRWMPGFRINLIAKILPRTPKFSTKLTFVRTSCCTFWLHLDCKMKPLDQTKRNLNHPFGRPGHVDCFKWRPANWQQVVILPNNNVTRVQAGSAKRNKTVLCPSLLMTVQNHLT